MLEKKVYEEPIFNKYNSEYRDIILTSNEESSNEEYETPRVPID